LRRQAIIRTCFLPSFLCASFSLCVSPFARNHQRVNARLQENAQSTARNATSEESISIHPSIHTLVSNDRGKTAARARHFGFRQCRRIGVVRCRCAGTHRTEVRFEDRRSCPSEGSGRRKQSLSLLRSCGYRCAQQQLPLDVLRIWLGNIAVVAPLRAARVVAGAFGVWKSAHSSLFKLLYANDRYRETLCAWRLDRRVTGQHPTHRSLCICIRVFGIISLPSCRFLAFSSILSLLPVR
jgi:hypothetical protein